VESGIDPAEVMVDLIRNTHDGFNALCTAYLRGGWQVAATATPLLEHLQQQLLCVAHVNKEALPLRAALGKVAWFVDKDGALQLHSSTSAKTYAAIPIAAILETMPSALIGVRRMHSFIIGGPVKDIALGELYEALTSTIDLLHTTTEVISDTRTSARHRRK
jgi:hypothetical protein